MFFDGRAITIGGLVWVGLSFVVVGAVGAQEGRPSAPRPSEAPAGRLAEPQFPRTYGPLDAGRDAYQRAEAKRREAVTQQRQLNDEMVWYSALPGYDRYPPSLSTIYAYGRVGPIRRAVRGLYWSGYYGYPAYPVYPTRGLFEPWPLVPGDVYGYPYLNRVEQPLGHKVIRTGPNSYIYRPVYESDLEQKPGPTLAPPEPEKPVPEPILAPPALNERQPEAIPAPPPERGPREL